MIKTLQHCLRCEKELYGDDVHTCTPSEKYRAGILEGMKIVFDKIDSSYDANEMATFSSYDYHEEVINMVDELIVKYSNGLGVNK